MTAGGCLASLKCLHQNMFFLQADFGWRILMAGLCGAGMWLLVSGITYLFEMRESMKAAGFSSYWEYVQAREAGRKIIRHGAAGGLTALVVLLLEEFTRFPSIDPALQIILGVLAGLAAGLLVEYPFNIEMGKTDGGMDNSTPQ